MKLSEVGATTEAPEETSKLGELWKGLAGGGASAPLPPKQQKLSQLGGSPVSLAKDDQGSTIGALWEGLKHGAEMTGRGVEQLAESMPTLTSIGASGRQKLLSQANQGIQQSEQQYQASPQVQAHPIASGIGRVGGEMAATAPLAMIPGGAAMRAASMAGKVGAGVAGGALGAATQPVQTPDYWTEKMKQVGVGGAIGGALPGIGGALAPRLPNPQLVAQGISRAFRPFYNFAMQAEERTIDGFDRAIARQVLDPVAGGVPKGLKGNALINHTEDTISDAYDRVLPNITLTKGAAATHNPDLAQELSELAPDDFNRYNKIVDNRLWNKFPMTGVMDGKTFKGVQSDLSRRAYSFIGTNNDDIGQALLHTMAHVNDMVAQTNPTHAGELKAANEAWKMYARMRSAASGPTAEGSFKPSDLLRALRTQDASAGKGAFAKGDMPLQGYAAAGEKALGGTRASPWDLLHIFARHGLPAEVTRQTAGPIGRNLKAMTPGAGPLGALGASATTPSEADQRRRDYYEGRGYRIPAEGAESG